MLATFSVTNINDGVVTDFGDQPGTLRQAIFDANETPGADTIDFDPAVFDEPTTITLTEGEPTITESVTIDATIDGDGPSEELLGITIDGGDGTDGVFNTADGFTVLAIGEFNPFGSPIDATLIGLTITGGDAANGLGGGIDFRFQAASLTVRDCRIIGNATNDRGGGVNVGAVDLFIERSEISGNTSQTDGGGLYWSAVSGHAQILDTLISENTAAEDGGGVAFYGIDETVFEIVGTTISGNTSLTQGSHGGGGVYAKLGDIVGSPATLMVDRSTISGNTAEKDGGGMFVYFHGTEDDRFILSNSTVSGNHAL